MNKLTFKKILSKWLIFIVYGILFVLVTTWVVDLINKPRGKETISLFLTSYEIDQEGLYDELKSISPDYLREININHYRKDDQYYNTFYQAIALGNADICIIPESHISGSIGSIFTPFDISYIEEYTGLKFEESDLYIVDGRCFGIKVYDKNKMESNKYMNFYKEDYPETEEDESVNENYYIVFYRKSVHIGAINESESQLALDFLKVFLNYEKNESS